LLNDVFSVVSHQPGTFGYGKIHAHMVRGADGALYATTYWGSERAVEYGNGYEGDVLLRIDPKTGELANLGVPVAHHGIPSLTISLDGRLLFGEAADPDPASSKGVFFVYDLNQRKVVFQMEKPTGAPGYRCVLVDGSGKAWFSTGEGEVSTYDPTANSVTKSDQRIPGEFLRADSRPSPDGTVYGVTQGETPTFFSISKDGRMTTMGPARGYTASLALSSDGKTLYYVPDAHGKSYLNGTPVIALDTATGDEREIVRLNDLIQPAMSLRAGGSYDIVLDDSGRTLYIGLNAGEPSTKEAFGHVVLAVVKLA
jgi:hypothetical protein